MRKKILVTGGAGFIGSHLCEFLIENPNFEVVRHDVIEPIRLEVDEIYNLACPASPIHYQFNPVETVKTCVMGMINMLELARRCKARILQASTSEIYGDPEEHPQKESYRGNVNCLGPRACYDEGKRVAETLMMDYHREYKVDIRIARIFNTYGPRMALNDGRVVSNFMSEALRGKDITIYGDGSQTRSFCYVTDLIKGLYLLMEQDKDIGPINLGNPHEITIKEFAERITKLSGSKSKVVYKDLPQDDPKKRRPDIEKAKRILKWEPTVKLEDGLKKTVDYFKKVLKV